jgi:hypothetical protein
MRVAARRSDIAFLVSMAGPGLSVGETFADRECDALAKAGGGAAAVERHRAYTLALYRNLQDRKDEPIDSAQLVALAAQFGASDTAVAKDSADWIARFNEPWFRSLVRLKPIPILQQVSTPFLAINGGLDMQVRADSNLGAMRQSLEEQKVRDFALIKLPGLNHLFQTCTTGAPYEYPAIEETFAPVALETIRQWLDARFVPGKSVD